MKVSLFEDASISRWEKISNSGLGVLFFGGLILLYGSDSFLKRLGFLDFKLKYNIWIGGAFLFSIIFLAIRLFNFCYLLIKQLRNRLRVESEIESKMLSLNFAEVLVIREFVLQHSEIIEAPMEDPIISTLLRCGVIENVKHATGGYLVNGRYMQYAISQRAKKYLTSDILGMPQNPKPFEISEVQNDRPRWAKSGLF